ncbi:MAG: LysR family transcriptional regulator [Roseburia sp.]|nr:LysR family transcriptional regulator [Roseburia sp.]
MTFNQLLYVVEVSKTKSINATAHALFVSQSCVSTAIRELEDELGIIIFNRTNRGITITKDGETFIHYANNIIQQCKLLEEKYLGGEEHKRHFSVVMHHSTVAAKAFANVVKEFGLLDYEYSIYETNTLTVLEKVRSAKSELGILYISTFNQDYYEKTFKELNLIFKSIAEYEVYAYIGENHPLASRKEIELSELEKYPCLIFAQDENSSFYFYEEIIRACLKNHFV